MVAILFNIMIYIVLLRFLFKPKSIYLISIDNYKLPLYLFVVLYMFISLWIIELLHK